MCRHSNRTTSRYCAALQSSAESADELSEIRECKNWLEALPAQTLSGNKPLERLQEVIELLQKNPSREKRDQIQKRLSNWDVPQFSHGRKRKYDDTKMDLAAKVVQETRRLKRLQHEHGDPADADQSTASNSRRSFSAIQTWLRRRR